MRGEAAGRGLPLGLSVASACPPASPRADATLATGRVRQPHGRPRRRRRDNKPPRGRPSRTGESDGQLGKGARGVGWRENGRASSCAMHDS